MIDAGSTDDTAQLVEGFAERADFPVRYAHQPNSGKHFALKQGVRLAQGKYTAVINPDDWYKPEALETLLAAWDNLPPGQPEYFEVQGLCEYEDGSLIGDRFPSGAFDTDGFEVTFVHNITGDKVGMQRTDVLKAFPFPELRVRYVTEALVWHRIARCYRLRGINEVLAVKEYQAEGITRTIGDEPRAVAEPMRMYYKEVLLMPRRSGVPNRFTTRPPLGAERTAKFYAAWLRYIIRSRTPIWREFRDAPSKLCFIAAIPPGAYLARRDARR